MLRTKNHSGIFILALGLLIAVAFPNISSATDCISQACISVQADQNSNSIIITAHQGSPGNSTTTKAKPKIIRPTAKPVPRSRQVYTWIPWKPAPRRTVPITPTYRLRFSFCRAGGSPSGPRTCSSSGPPECGKAWAEKRVPPPGLPGPSRSTPSSQPGCWTSWPRTLTASAPP